MKLRVLLLLALASVASAANEIGFIERFALAPDRDKVLSELLPGSDDYYFFQALHWQNTRQTARLAELLQDWRQRYPSSPRRETLENRELLLSFDTAPQPTLAFLRKRYGLTFQHEQQIEERAPDLPTALDPGLISRDAFRQRMLAENTPIQCTPEAAARLISDGVVLSADRRHQALAQIHRPNVRGLVEAIAADLARPESRGFGELEIHRRLLPEQLDALQRLRPDLADTEACVRLRLAQLAPSREEDVDYDAKARQAWLDRLWNYARTLSASFNGVKAAIMYARLDHDRHVGTYDEARLIEYLNVPRMVSYGSAEWVRDVRAQGKPLANLSQQSVPLLRPIGQDEALVRDYLLHLFAATPMQNYQRFAKCVRESWLREAYAEALLVRGLGSADRLIPLIPGNRWQELNQRVDLDLALTNPQFLEPTEAVNVDVEVKNVPKLIVRVYELNALNWYLSEKRELNTDLPLDGLVATKEMTYTYEEPSIRRVRRTFTFPELLNRRGAWIIEFIGGGRSSRVLLRKGRWQTIQHPSAGGDLITVLDEEHRRVLDAVVWVDGRAFPVDAKRGTALIPFSHEPATKPLVVTDAAGTFAILSEFEHHAERYELDASFHVEREQLLSGMEASLSVRAALRVEDAQLPLALLTDVELSLTFETVDGLTTTTTARSPALVDTGLFEHRFRVPERLKHLHASLTGKIGLVSKGGEKQTLSAAETWDLGVPPQFAGHLTRSAAGYAFELRGRNGEPVINRAINFEFYHREFSGSITASLRTDNAGRIALGSLAGIHLLVATDDTGTALRLPLPFDETTEFHTLHVAAGEVIELPLHSNDVDGLSLFSVRGPTLIQDLTAQLKVNAGKSFPFARIEGLPAGSYLLIRPSSAHAIQIEVSAGHPAEGWLLSESRHLEATDGRRLRIADAEIEADTITLTVANAGPATRVQIAASRFLPGQFGLLNLAPRSTFVPGEVQPARLPNLYSDGRDIGDEYRYILERRYSPHFPGNLLDRPGLLLNPWKKRETERSVETMTQMQAALPAPGSRARNGKLQNDKPAPQEDSVPTGTAEPDLDFLSTAAPVLLNLQPDANGILKVSRKQLGDRSLIQLLALDGEQADWRTITLPDTPVALRDRRIAQAYDPSRPVAEQKRISGLASGEKLTISNRVTSTWATYDSIASVFALYRTLNPGLDLSTFERVSRWPALGDVEKRQLYSELSSHELNVFLSRKDPDFFQAVIAPYLRNKQQKTFIDDYVLGNDLRHYLEPWSFAQLNAAEQALLATSMPAEAAGITRHLRERLEIQPLGHEEWSRFFNAALAQMMPGGVGSGFAAEAQEKSARGDADAPPPLAPAPASVRPSSAAPPIVANSMPSEPEMLFKGEGARRVIGAADAVAQRTEAVANAYYRKLGATHEWAENNYYHLPISEQGPELIEVNAFWRDLAAWAASGMKGPFLSAHFLEAHHSLAEAMLALAVLDLPFEPGKHQSSVEGAAYSLKAATPLLLVHREVLPTEAGGDRQDVLVSQSFSRVDDQFIEEGNGRRERYVEGQFEAGVAYIGKVTISNPSPVHENVDVLTQVPEGAIPLGASQSTQSRTAQLAPFTTMRLEYSFYFPSAGTTGVPFRQYPAQVSMEGRIVGSARPHQFIVVRQLKDTSNDSWVTVSQRASDAEVLRWLDGKNIERVDLEKIAWRCRRNPAFYSELMKLLRSRHRFDETIYSYSLVHRDVPGLREWLRRRPDLGQLCGPRLDCTLLNYDPVDYRTFEYLEYAPLVNQRAHRLGGQRTIANDAVLQQYQAELERLAYAPKLSALDSLKITGFFFLQDRVDEALTRLRAIDAKQLTTRLQYDYFNAYAAMYVSDVPKARAIAEPYINYPVERWRTLFRTVVAQLDEVEGRSGTRPDPTQPDRSREMGALAAAQPVFDLAKEDRAVVLTWQNLTALTVNYYLVDPEFSFSTAPFAQSGSTRVPLIRPTRSVKVDLPLGENRLRLPLPVEFSRANVQVEAVAAGQRKTLVYHAAQLRLMVAERFGQLEVREAESGKPLARSYVKVYARLKNGTVRFFKDGYTDLRGKFDYASLNSSGGAAPEPPVPMPVDHSSQMLNPSELGSVDRLAVLVLSETHGAAVRELSPPAE